MQRCCSNKTTSNSLQWRLVIHRAHKTATDRIFYLRLALIASSTDRDVANSVEFLK